MWVKVLSTFGFLVALGLSAFLATKQQRRTLRKVGSRNTGVVNYIFTMGNLLVTFVQFWCLTRIFPVYMILSMMAASLVGVVLYNLIGAIAGFGHAENNAKINAMNLILSAQHKETGCIALSAGLITLGSMGVVLYKFWRLPFGSPEAIAWIALLSFIVPQILLIITTLAVVMPILSSEYVDADVRNSALCVQFSSIIYSTIALIFPVWILKEHKALIFQWMPPEWVILSIPSLIFLFSCLVPFLIGTHRYRSQRRAQLDWRKRWLTETQDVVAGAAPLTEKMQELETEIAHRQQSNELRQFIENLFPPQQNLTGGAQPAPVAQSGTVADVFKVISDNKDKLHEWDPRFRETDKLCQLSQDISQATDEKRPDIVELKLKHTNDDIADLAREKSVLTGGISGVLTTIGPIVFKVYGDKIVSVFGSLMGLNH